MDNKNQITVPVYEVNDDGSIVPNPLFHRSWDKLHSRCIEYPFAAAQLGYCKNILDVGTVKSDPFWIKWLESLSIEVHAVDYDLPDSEYSHIVFFNADLRKLPIATDSYEKIFAISVIEHIGMDNPQVFSQTLPMNEEDGDQKAFAELIRVLKPGGELVMTLPFGKIKEQSTSDSTRVYTKDTIKKFEKFATPISLDYYEYQYSKYLNTFPEYIKPKNWRQKILSFLNMKQKEILNPINENQLPEHFGLVTWRKLPVNFSNAIHYGHADGVICGIWRKEK